MGKQRKVTAFEAAEAEKCPLMQAKRARQRLDRDDVRRGQRMPESMTFDSEEARKTFILTRRSWDY